MTSAELRAAAKQFITDWKGRGDEKQETQSFWLSLLQQIYGVGEPTKYIDFERRVEVDDTRTGKSTTKFIDGYIPMTRVLIEQKGADIDLSKGYKQSDGSMLTPYQQARRYGGYLPQGEQPRWIVVCNFRSFEIHDMNRPNDEPEVVALADLEKEYHRLAFLVDKGNENIKKEMDISLQAGQLVGVLYDALLRQYKEPNDPETLKSLNALCVRLVFCLYAEDADIFGEHTMFHDYLQAHAAQPRDALIKLFKILDTKPEDRDPYLDDDLLAFPYVNGGLFADENIIIPRLDETIVDLILHKASEDFDWSAISPTIFGAVFESTLNPETRRSGGMHYTSIENIHKVIDPLFLDDLREELHCIEGESLPLKERQRKLRSFQARLASLRFLDPACGSGNFLTETYLSLRRLENEVISLLNQGQIIMDFGNPIQISIGQFYGIEINDFAVTVAKTALWIAESQMMKETEDVVQMSLDFLPLKSYANITEGNALKINWPKTDFIMGNPPFVGASMMTKEQKDEAVAIFGKGKRVNSIDYVGAWYHKAAALMQESTTRAAFVSTNSITQGEQVAPLWEKLLKEYHVHIDFAYRTFKWSSEAKEKAAVHCVIIGFSVAPSSRPKYIFTNTATQAQNINPYLIDAPDILIASRSTPLCAAPRITYGNKPSDGGNLILSQDERDMLITQDEHLMPYIRRYVGARDFINRDEIRYCLWLRDAPPTIYRKNSEIMKRLRRIKELRAASTAAPTRAFADKPFLFFSSPQTEDDYLIIPNASSEQRRYIPIGFMTKDVIASNAIQIIPKSTLYHFGVLTSNVHMAWMRVVTGRLKSDYQYSGAIVYNNFPWPILTEEQKAKIEQTAQAILDARALYPDSSLADLYDEATMPPELRKAHQDNDRAVMCAYGFKPGEMTESSCVAELMKLYQQLVEEGR